MSVSKPGGMWPADQRMLPTIMAPVPASLYERRPSGRALLADAELCEDAVEEVGGGGFAGDFAEDVQGGAQVYGDEVKG